MFVLLENVYKDRNYILYGKDFFCVELEDLPSVADGLHDPVEFEVELFLSGELPMDGGVGAHPFGETEEGKGGADADVEALGEAVHGDLDVGVGSVDDLLGEAGEFCSEDKGDRLPDVELGDE